MVCDQDDVYLRMRRRRPELREARMNRWDRDAPED